MIDIEANSVTLRRPPSIRPLATYELCRQKRMFSLNETNRFYLHTRGTDLRKGFTLPGVIRSHSEQNNLLD